MRTYETLFIIHPDLDESEITKTIDVIQESITTGGGTILKADRWGRSQLAYEVQKKREGYYVLIYFEGPPQLLPELNRRYKLTDAIMRSIVVQLRKDQAEEILRAGDVVPSREPQGEEAPEVVSDNKEEQEEKVEVDTEEEATISGEEE